MRTILSPEIIVDERGDIVSGSVAIVDGRIAAIGTDVGPLPGDVRIELAGRMLLPSFVNAHSHAFQRALRGRVEQRSVDRPSEDFWSWREAMYGDAARVSCDDVEALAAWCYLDMLRSGFGAVAEFHYVHHDRDGAPHAGPAMSRAIARAARSVGLRVVILETAYARAGVGKVALLEQRRFVFDDVARFVEHARAARQECDGDVVTHGLAVHSIRACPRDWIEAVAAEARAWGAPLHVHACEQRAELVACEAEHGMSPLALLEATGALTSSSTVVHATHIDAREIARLAASGAGVCICPSTERNLGDGLCPIEDLVRAGVPLSVGSDSHARIDVTDELRSLEDHERLRLERRNVLVQPGKRLAHAILPAGTVGGATALGLPSGRMQVGAPADLVAVAVPLEGSGDAAAGLDAWLVGGSGHDVTDVFVAGARVLKDGRPTHADARAIEERARRVLARLRG